MYGQSEMELEKFLWLPTDGRSYCKSEHGGWWYQCRRRSPISTCELWRLLCCTAGWRWRVVGGGGPDIRDSRKFLKCRLFLDSHVERVKVNVVEGDRWRARHNWKDGITLDLKEFRLGNLNCLAG